MRYLIIALTLATKLVSQNITSDLVICMPLDGNALDISGNNNHGTVTAVTSTTDRFGNPNSALQFDGSSSKIVVPASPSINNIEILNELTITSWCKINSFGNTNCFPIANKYNATTDWGWDYTVQPPATWNGQIFVPNYQTMGGNYAICKGNEGVTSGQWDFYAITFSRSNSNFKVYKNTVLLNSVNTSTYTLEATSNGNLFIGYSPAVTDDYANGFIDDFKMYSRALTATEISLLYKGGSCFVNSVNENKVENSLCSVFPNPSFNQLKLKVRASERIFEEIEIEVISLDGKLLKRNRFIDNNTKDYLIDISDIAPGFYMLRFSSGEYVQTMKFIKE